MTTIAYREGVVAYDSRCCAGGKVSSDHFNKHRRAGRVHFFFTGNTGDIERLIALYMGTDSRKPMDGCQALVWDGRSGQLLSIGWDGQYFTNEESLDTYCAFGTGEDHAITAMDCGLSAADAVRMAAKRDTGTGGRVRTYKITGRK